MKFQSTDPSFGQEYSKVSTQEVCPASPWMFFLFVKKREVWTG